MAEQPDTVTALVFGRDDAGGNPATVEWLDREPGDDELQAAAAAHGTPVTAFVLPGDPPRLRFFTARSELSFCGHGSLAAGAAVAHRHGAIAAQLRSGSRELRIELEPGDLATLILDGPGSDRREHAPGPLLAALGVASEQVIGDVAIASVGSPKWLVEVGSAAVLAALRPDMTALAAVSATAGVNGAYVYCRDRAVEGVDALARGFNPRGGVAEDAATGVAAGALAWHLRDQLAGRPLVVEQGIELRDLNRLVARVDGDQIRVGGRVNLVTSEAP